MLFGEQERLIWGLKGKLVYYRLIGYYAIAFGSPELYLWAFNLKVKIRVKLEILMLTK